MLADGETGPRHTLQAFRVGSTAAEDLHKRNVTFCVTYDCFDCFALCLHSLPQLLNPAVAGSCCVYRCIHLAPSCFPVGMVTLLNTCVPLLLPLHLLPVQYGTQDITLSAAEQLVDRSQTRAIADSLKWLQARLKQQQQPGVGSKTLHQWLVELEALFDAQVSNSRLMAMQQVCKSHRKVNSFSPVCV